jgi:hypothetical protein
MFSIRAREACPFRYIFVPLRAKYNNINPFQGGRSMNALCSKWSVALLNVAVLAVLASFLSGNALAREITYATKMGPVLSRTVFTPGDKSGHELVQAVRTDMTSGADSDWNETSVTNYGQADLVDGSGTVSGYAVRTHKNGDKTYYRYEGKVRATGTGSTKETVGEGTVELIGGTGKFANARGNGTYSSGGGVSTIKLKYDY